mmetsp:Transcript_7104/g.15571  ORF Transcript_7104/g.15571 Transcript_7104/m.15571 type:complete len:100 (+) Transcript_7104:940-1239(+)
MVFKNRCSCLKIVCGAAQEICTLVPCPRGGQSVAGVAAQQLALCRGLQLQICAGGEPCEMSDDESELDFCILHVNAACEMYIPGLLSVRASVSWFCSLS